MKEKYMKPHIRIEYFSLNQSVATSCGWNSNDYYGKPGHGDPYSCTWTEITGDVYWATPAACGEENVVSGDLEIGEGCYNAPSGSQQIFAS